MIICDDKNKSKQKKSESFRTNSGLAKMNIIEKHICFVVTPNYIKQIKNTKRINIENKNHNSRGTNK